jgi:signal transduction histidine kinase
MSERTSNPEMGRASKRRSWSVAARTTWWFGVTTAVLVIVICAISAVFLTRSTETQIDSLLAIGTEEFAADFRESQHTREEAAAIADTVQKHHADTRMAWRVWDSETHEVWGEFGNIEMLTATAPAPQPIGQSDDVPGAKRWRSEQVTPRYVAGLMVDGSGRMTALREFGALSLLLAVIAGVIAFGAGAVFIRRSCNLLRNVSEKVRNVHAATNTAELEIPDAPDEIRDIVDALQHALANIRAETDRAHLMTTGVAHELGSPLQNLIGETEVALLSDRTTGEYKRVLESHLEELRDLGNALGNLMTLCALDAGRGAELEKFDLAEEARLRLRREYSHADRCGVHLEVASHGDLSMRGDREALLLAIGNLVANAIDWAPNGSDVRLAMRGDASAVRITVDDSGPGVADVERPKIFEPFYRGPCANGKRAGYGLGLAIAKKAVETHGGSVEVARSPQGGARFEMQLPRERRPKD